MKEKIRLTSLYQQTEFTAKTQINGEWKVLTETFREVSATTFETDPAFKHERILKISFTPQQKYWELEWDSEDIPLKPLGKDASSEERFANDQLREANEINRRKRIAAREFFPRHNQLAHGTDFNNGFSPNATPVATLEAVTQRGRLNHLKDRKKAKVFTMIDAMPWMEQYDLILYYAPDLCIGKRRSEMLHGLIGLKDVGTERAHTGGRMWQKNPSGKGILADDFLMNYKKTNHVVMKIYIEKAILLGIITRGVGGLYLQEKTFVGKDSTEAVVYFSKDNVSYTNIVQTEVNANSELPEDDMVEQPVDMPEYKTEYQKKEDAKKNEAAERLRYSQLIQRAERMSGKDVPQNKRSMSELEKYVEELQAELDTQSVAAVSPTIQLAAQVGDLNAMGMDELKAVAADMGLKPWAFSNKDKLILKIQKKREEQEA